MDDTSAAAIAAALDRVGPRLRRLRTQRRITLTGLATTTGIRTPVRAPRANAIAERWIGTLGRECLDHLLIIGRRHLGLVLQEYIAHYNALWVPRTVSRLLTSAFVAAQARRPPAVADQHDRPLWPSDSPTSCSDAC